MHYYIAYDCLPTMARAAPPMSFKQVCKGGQDRFTHRTTYHVVSYAWPAWQAIISV